jgi:hypothetical protein
LGPDVNRVVADSDEGVEMLVERESPHRPRFDEPVTLRVMGLDDSEVRGLRDVGSAQTESEIGR